MRVLLIIVLVVWVFAVAGWVHQYGGRSYAKLAGLLALGALVGLVGFLLLGLIWWALGAFMAMLAMIVLIFVIISWLDRRKADAFDATG